jgi:hypothetical protein
MRNRGREKRGRKCRRKKVKVGHKMESKKGSRCIGRGGVQAK